MKKGLIISVFLIGIFTISFVSAEDINYALVENGGVIFEECVTGDLFAFSSIDMIIDGDLTNLFGVTNYKGIPASQIHRGLLMGICSFKIDFDTPKSISKVDLYSWTNLEGFSDPVLQLEFVDGTFEEISNQIDLGSGIVGNTVTSVPGSWTNVVAVHAGIWHGADWGIRELEAWGPGSVIPPVIPPVVTCSDNDIILKLSDPTNAHGAIWSDGTYTENICYSEIFASSIDFGPSAHVCDGTNGVLSLSDTTNAHASGYDYSLYTTKVCFGDLVCDIDLWETGDEDCGSFGGSLVASLSDDANAHLISGSDTTNYPYQVCCKSVSSPGPGPIDCGNGVIDVGEACDNSASPSIPVGTDCSTIPGIYTGGSLSCDSSCNFDTTACTSAPLGSVYWADMNGDLIPDGENAEIGDSVLLIYNVPYDPVASLSFTILEDDPMFDDDIKTITALFDYNGMTVAEWIITEDNFNDGVEGIELDDGVVEFKFIIEGLESSLLYVSGYDNTMPTTQIDNPNEGDIYIIDSATGKTGTINLMQTSTDVDDDLRVVWNMGDDVTLPERNNILTTGNGDTTYQYSTSGSMLIWLFTTEMSRGQWVEDFERIFVYKEGISIFAKIDEPASTGVIEGAGNKRIDGSSSEVVDCDFDESQCNSRSGGVTCYKVDDSLGSGIGPLYCYKFADSSDPNFKFKWTFDGIEDLINTDSTPFQKLFIKPGKHKIDLTVSYTY